MGEPDKHCPDLDPKLHSVILEKSLALLGLPNTYSLIGGRTCGSAYLSNGRVYKVTTDKSEAIESNKIVGKHNPNLVDIYDVKRVNNSLTDVPVYLIVMEHLRTDRDSIFAEIEDELTEIFSKELGIHYMDLLYYYRFEPQTYKNEYEEDVNRILESHQREKFYYNSLLKIVDALRANNIESLDLQYHNLGLKPNGNLAFFDLGYGDTSGNVGSMTVNERVKSYMPKSSAVGIARKCKFGGNPDGTSNACNKGDISNITMKPINENMSQNMIQILSGLKSKFADAAQSVYNEWEQDEEGYDEVYGGGGICDDIADRMCDVVQSNTQFNCFTQYNEHDCHTSIYVYDIAEKTLIFVDINPFHYETGTAYTWKKIPGVRFTPDMVSIDDHSGYWENFFDEDNEMRDMSEAKTIGIGELPFKQDIEQAGGKLYSVGGAVRDAILGKESKDLDILITGLPLDSLEQILAKYGRVDNVGKSFGIIKFNSPQTGEIDIAIPRTERKNDQGGYQGFDVTSDHTLPIEKDLERRDFTINAIAKDSSGLMIDPYGGKGDIDKKQIKMVNPQAFSDDPLRMLRAVQFASRFGFSIEPETLAAIQQNASKIREISPERILIEFDKIVKKGDPMTGAKLLRQTGLYNQIFGLNRGVNLAEFKNVKTMGEFIFALLNGAIANPSEFYKNNLKGDIDTYNELKALEIGKKFNGNLKTIFDMYKAYPKVVDSEFLNQTLKETIAYMRSNNMPFSLKDIPVDGNDLMQFGLKGKQIGDAFVEILNKIYGRELPNEREAILDYIKTR